MKNKEIKLDISEVDACYLYRNNKGEMCSKWNFKGLFASIKLPKQFNTTIHIRKDSNDMISALTNEFEKKLSYDNFKLEMDSQEFEKKFNIYATNQIVAMQLLTSEVMLMLIEFYNNIEREFEVTIKDNYIYLRIWIDAIFEVPPLKKSTFDQKILYKNYSILNFIFELSDKLTKLIDYLPDDE